MHSKDIAWLAVASVLSLKLASGLAVAGDFEQPAAPSWGMAGNLYGAYAHLNPTSGGDQNLLGGGGSFLFGLNDRFFIQGSGVVYGGLDSSSSDFASLDVLTFWRDQQFGLFGIGAGWDNIDGTDVGRAGGRFDIYGADVATFSGGLGVFEGAGKYGGFFAEGGITFYPLENLAIGSTLSYADFRHSSADVVEADVRAEYLLAAIAPLSIFAGYRYSDMLGGGINASTVFVGAKFYFGNPGDGSLLGWHRNNSAEGLNISSIPGVF